MIRFILKLMFGNIAKRQVKQFIERVEKTVKFSNGAADAVI